MKFLVQIASKRQNVRLCSSQHVEPVKTWMKESSEPAVPEEGARSDVSNFLTSAITEKIIPANFEESIPETLEVIATLLGGANGK